MVGAHEPIPQSLQTPAGGGEERGRQPGLPGKPLREKPLSSRTNGTPSSITWAGARVLAKAAEHLQQVGTQSRERDGPAPWCHGGMNNPGLHSSTWEGPWECLGKAGDARLHRRSFYGGLGSVN